ncbi:MAG TPA: hypothetical protein VLM37_08655 [Fibrobacteraceae bacterium]|nr:hypothetical protein [Fibrobacteraceae bacterium]
MLFPNDKIFPKKAGQDTVAFGFRRWIKVVGILVIIAGLTWLGKFHHAAPKAVRKHGLICWTFPTSKGLSSLIVLGDDGKDSNLVRTGLRIWLHPPTHPRAFEASSHAVYRGPSLVLVGDSLEPATVKEAATMVDTGGTLVLLGTNDIPSSGLPHLRILRINWDGTTFDWLQGLQGEDVQAHFSLPDTKARRPEALSLEWHGFRAIWWFTRSAALADSASEPLSSAILLPRLEDDEQLPLSRKGEIRSLIFCGSSHEGMDSSRIQLPQDSSGALLVEDLSGKQLWAKRIHLPQISP